MNKNKKKKLINILIGIFGCILFVFAILIRRPSQTSSNIKWGVAFSRRFAQDMGLDWRESYIAMLDDLGVKYIRLPIYWEDIEPKEREFNFGDYDWMINEAEKREVKLILAIGRKTPRWPECHVPGWAGSLAEADQQQKVLNMLPKIIERYKNSPSLYLWQVENEFFLDFGICPKKDKNFLDREIALVGKLDPAHKILTTDSGELSIWVRAAKRGDVFGTTMYRTLWHKYTGYLTYPLGPRFFWFKANIVRLFFPGKPIIVSELQAEPWGTKSIVDMTIDEQFITLSPQHFDENIEYARKVGFSEIYLWGAEWWYWMKTKKDHPEFWEKAKRLMEE